MFSEDHIWLEIPNSSFHSAPEDGDSSESGILSPSSPEIICSSHPPGEDSGSNSRFVAIEVTWRAGKSIEDRRSHPFFTPHSAVPTSGVLASSGAPSRAPTVETCIGESRWAYSNGHVVRCSTPAMLIVGLLTFLHKDHRYTSAASSDPIMAAHCQQLGSSL